VPNMPALCRHGSRVVYVTLRKHSKQHFQPFGPCLEISQGGNDRTPGTDRPGQRVLELCFCLAQFAQPRHNKSFQFPSADHGRFIASEIPFGAGRSRL
jgi:hypothetical protein